MTETLTEEEINHLKEEMRRFGNDTVVRCKTCGRTQYLRFYNGLRYGWSMCHGYTMRIIYQEADIDKAVGNIVKSSFGEMKRNGST